MPRLALHAALLTALPCFLSAQISLVHVTSCGPQTLPGSVCSIPATGAGNLIVVGIGVGGGANTSTRISSVADNSGNTYAEAGNALAVDSAAGSLIDIWYAKNTTAGATTLTINTSVAVTGAAVVVWEWAGANTVTPLDQTAVLNSQTATATPSGAAVATTASADVVIALAAAAGNVTGVASGNAFMSDSALKGYGWAHLITSAPGTFAAQWAQSASGTYAASTASFKAAAAGGGGSLSACDLNGDGAVNVIDVQWATNMNLGLRPCTANIAGSGVCSPLVVQQVINASLTGTCATAGSHAVTLNWNTSTTPSVNYNVYRSTTAGSLYAKISPSAVSAISYVDSTVVAGQTYYYVVTAIDSNNNESVYSNQATATVPFP